MKRLAEEIIEMGLENYSGSSSPEVKRGVLRSVIYVALKKRATYPSEISNFCEYDPSTIGRACRILERAEVLQRIKPARYNPRDPRIVARLAELSEKNLSGQEITRSINWYGLPDVAPDGREIVFKRDGKYQYYRPSGEELSLEEVERMESNASEYIIEDDLGSEVVSFAAERVDVYG